MATSYRFGEFELDTAAGELRHRDERVPLEPKVFDLLMHLLRHRDRIVSVPELLTAVWADISVERGSVHRAVRLLRRALSDQATQLEAIVTVPRRGYRFAQDVKEIANQSASRAGPTFVGREEICGELDARLERAMSGSQTGLALLHGPAGIGKSATLARLRRSAERLGATVFEGRCIEGPAAPPYRPWSRILRAALRLDGATDLAAGLETGLHDVAQALPEIGAALGVRIQANEVIDPGAQHRVHAAIASWIRLRCRRSPLVLLIDDLHRADLDSIQLLAFLIQDLTDEPLLLATAFRDRPEQISNPAAVDALITLRPDAPIRLAEFSQSEVEEFARERSDETWTSSELDRLWLASGGNPLFVEQLVRTHGADRRSPPLGPPAAGLRGALRRLLEDASLPCSEMLSMASVFGRAFEPAVLAAGLGRSMIEIQTAIDEAVQLRLLEPDEDPEYRFVHGLFPEVLYADLSSAERIEQHGRALSGLIAMQAGPRHRLTELAHHAHEAASRIGIRRAFDYAIAAANDAAKRLAFEDAIQLFKRALEIRDPRAGDEVDRAARANCLIDIATLLVMRGAAAAARPFFDDAAELAREIDDPKLFA
ncbi:MAG: AAA family ATPase, partial [Myxococcota bacterium]